MPALLPMFTSDGNSVSIYFTVCDPVLCDVNLRVRYRSFHENYKKDIFDKNTEL